MTTWTCDRIFHANVNEIAEHLNKLTGSGWEIAFVTETDEDVTIYARKRDGD